jgi:monothiol glutaredoxin
MEIGTNGRSTESSNHDLNICILRPKTYFGLVLISSEPRNPPTVMEKPKITAYLKTYCGWSEGVRAIMRKYELPYEEKDIIANPAFRWEMEQKSGQPLSPCVEINGKMLPDISGEEVEQYLVANNLITASNAEADAPIDSACTNEQHEAMARQAGQIKFIA